MKYKATYKCRLCGKTFIEGTVKKKSVGEAIHLLSVEGKSESQYRKSQIHFCDNGDVGHADFQGFQKKAPSQKRNRNSDSEDLHQNMLVFLMLAVILFSIFLLPLYVSLRCFVP